VIVTERIPDKLSKKSNLVYFKGKTIHEGRSISNTFKFNPKYPREFWNGYLVLAELDGGGKYFVWHDTTSFVGMGFDGWFVTMEGTWQNEGDEYLSVIMPVVERKY
jgi:hypothetical protein